MSVPARNRKEHDLQLFVDASKLAAEVIRLSKNEKVIPARYYLTCGLPMIEAVRSLCVELQVANDLRLENNVSRAERFRHQQQALLKVIELKTNFDINVQFVNPSNVHPYTDVVNHLKKVKTYIDKWIKSDERRIKELNDPAHQEVLMELDELDTPEQKRAKADKARLSESYLD